MSVEIYSAGHFWNQGGLVSSGDTISGAVIARNGNNSMVVNSGGIAESTTVNSGGSMYVSNGGIASDTTINAQGYAEVHSGGVMNGVSIANSGMVIVLAGGEVSSATLTGNAYGYASMGVAGSAESVVLNYRGRVSVTATGAVSGAEVTSGGSMSVSSGGIVSGGSVSSGGFLSIASGGSADDLTVSAGGLLGGISFNSDMYWSSFIGGVTQISENVTIEREYMTVSSGGVAPGVSIYSEGTMEVLSGGSADGTVINSRGVLRASAGAAVTNLVAANYARLTFYIDSATNVQGSYNNSAFEISAGQISGYTIQSAGYLGIGNGGAAQDTTVTSMGYLHVSSGGSAVGTVINSRGECVISSGGVMQDTVVSNGGYLTITSGSLHQGSLQMGSRSIISVENGAIIDFTVSNMSAGDDYLISNLSKITSAPTYTITIAANQAVGTYRLAQNAENFSGTVSISNGTDDLGSVTVNGDDLILNDISYSLDKANGNLTFTIAPVLPPAVFIYSSGTLVSSGALISDAILSGSGNDSMIVSSGGVVSGTVVNSGGWVEIYSGGTAEAAMVNSGGNMYVQSGGVVDNVIITSGGDIVISSGGTATNLDWTPCNGNVSAAPGAVVTYLSSFSGVYNGESGSLLSHGSTMSSQEVNGSMYVMANGTAAGATVNAGGIMFVSSGGIANDTLINSGRMDIGSGGAVSGTINWGSMHIFSGGTADQTSVNWDGVSFVSSGGMMNHATVANNGYIYVYEDGAVNDVTVNSNGRMCISSGGVVSNTVVNSNGRMYISSGGVHCGTLHLSEGAVVSAYSGAVLDFTLAGRTAADGYLINEFGLIRGTPICTVTVSATQSAGTYKLAQGVYSFTGSITVKDDTQNYGTLTVGGDELVYNDITYSLNCSNGNLTLVISGDNAINNLQADASGASWDAVAGADGYTAEYSLDNFATVIQVNTTGNGLDTYQVPGGAWQLQVKVDDAETFEAQSSFTVPEITGAAEVLISDGDGNMDIFFARSSEVWDDQHVAKHCGFFNGWTGTHERVELTGKNIIEDVFSGSTADAALLVLTDDTNGDVLFLDDIYSAHSDQAHLSNIDEIRAGAGDDVVDLTTYKFACAGENMTVYGGEGNDTIWANAMDNILYGDAGNDRIVGGSGNDFIIGGAGNDSLHGGGGVDTFCFGSDWGTDTVEQLSGGKVILWFESGSMDNWDAANATYTVGSNSVRVDAADIELRFGGDISTLPAGAFAASASGKIFEETNGILA